MRSTPDESLPSAKESRNFYAKSHRASHYDRPWSTPGDGLHPHARRSLQRARWGVMGGGGDSASRRPRGQPLRTAQRRPCAGRGATWRSARTFQRRPRLALLGFEVILGVRAAMRFIRVRRTTAAAAPSGTRPPERTAQAAENPVPAPEKAPARLAPADAGPNLDSRFAGGGGTRLRAAKVRSGSTRSTRSPAASSASLPLQARVCSQSSPTGRRPSRGAGLDSSRLT